VAILGLGSARRVLIALMIGSVGGAGSCDRTRERGHELDAQGGAGGAPESCQSVPPTNGKCGSQYWQYEDEVCDPWDESEEDQFGPRQCFELGDHQCYLPCEDDSDCPPCAPKCCGVELCRGGDGCGEGQEKVCATADASCPLF
jgi:hypothetical protein